MSRHVQSRWSQQQKLVIKDYDHYQYWNDIGSYADGEKVMLRTFVRDKLM